MWWEILGGVVAGLLLLWLVLLLGYLALPASGAQFPLW
jgi:hypothetical protein